MLALRLQRVGRKKLPMYRLVAQEHSRHASSGRVSANLGAYNPHTKEFNFDKEKVEFYLGNGAQPSNRVAILLKKHKVSLPDWVNIKVYAEKKKEAEVVEASEAAPATDDKKEEAVSEPAEATEEQKAE